MPEPPGDLRPAPLVAPWTRPGRPWRGSCRPPTLDLAEQAMWKRVPRATELGKRGLGPLGPALRLLAAGGSGLSCGEVGGGGEEGAHLLTEVLPWCCLGLAWPLVLSRSTKPTAVLSAWRRVRPRQPGSPSLLLSLLVHSQLCLQTPGSSRPGVSTQKGVLYSLPAQRTAWARTGGKFLTCTRKESPGPGYFRYSSS